MTDLRAQTKSWAGAIVVVGTIAAYFLLLLALGGRTDWNVLGVPDLSPSFMDTRVITAGWDCDRAGFDVLETNPCDPSERPVNYPRLWLLPGELGLGQEATVAIGVGIALVFFAAVLALVGRTSARAGAAYAVAVISPAVMLGVERGNTDLLIFALLVVAVWLLRLSLAGRLMACTAIVVATALKLFPIFSLAVLFGQPRRTTVWIGAVALVSLAAYGLVTLDDLRLIHDATPQANRDSYGGGVGLSEAHRSIADTTGLSWIDSGAAIAVTRIGIELLALAVAAWVAFGRRLPAAERDAVWDSREADAFVVGAAIYAGTFLAFISWEYRLVFLLFTLAQLLKWSGARASPVPAPRLTLFALLLILWIPSDHLAGAAVQHIVSFFLFVTLAAGLMTMLGSTYAHQDRLVIRRMKPQLTSESR